MRNSPKILAFYIFTNNKNQTFQISDDSGDRFTFEELYLNTIRAAQNLQRKGHCESKQVITIMSGNVAHLAPIVFAALCLGCPINPLDIQMEKSTVLNMIQLTRPHLVFCEIKAYDLIAEVLAELKMDTKVFTFNGSKGKSIPVETLFTKTGTEDSFM